MLLLLSACTPDYEVKPAAAVPLELVVTNPKYGTFTGSPIVVVTGRVSPVDALVKVNGETVSVEPDGRFHTTTTFPGTDRATVIDVQAVDSDETARVLVPVFDGMDPRLADPGAIAGLLTPTGLDALEPLVEAQIDALGWEDQIFSILPGIDTDYFDIVPDSVTSAGADVDLAPATDAVTLTAALRDVTLTSNVVVLDYLEFPVSVVIGEILVGADTAPEVDDEGMLSLRLDAAQVNIGDFGLSFGGYEIPEEIIDLLMDPISDLIAYLGEGLGDLLLDQVGTLAIGGPFAFEADLLGTPLALRLVEVGADSNGIGLGLTVSTDGEAADELPPLDPLTPTTPSGRPYQLGLAIHEGLFNTLLGETLSGFLDLDLELDGATAELLSGGIRALPGGDQMPSGEGMCLGIHAGEAQVVRFEAGEGAPLARLWMPDLRVNIDTKSEGSCITWLDAQLLAVIDLNLRGEEISADLNVRDAWIVAYGAEGVDDEEVAAGLGAVVSGLASVLVSQLSFDLADLFGALGETGLPMNPTLVAVEPLDRTGRYGLYLDVF